MSRQVSPDILADAHESIGLSLEAVSRLSLSENRLHMWAEHFKSDRTRSLLDMASSYGDPTCTEFRLALSRYLRVQETDLLITNGSDEALLLLAVSRLGFEEVVLFEGTFAGHRACAAVSSMTATVAPLLVNDCELRIPSELFTKSNCMFFICSPHNPTGMPFNRHDVLRLMNEASARNNLVVVDEAYVEFSDSPRGYLDCRDRQGLRERVVLLRSLSKFWGLAGLRCGFLVADRSFLAKLAPVKRLIPYSVNRIVLAIASEIVNDANFARARKQHSAAMQVLRDTLDNQGRFYLPSVTNFLCVRAESDDLNLADGMLKHRVLVKDLSTVGRPGWFRVSTGSRSDMEQLALLLQHETGQSIASG
jgi:histidinol-phosphate/aromatic aminotransferase/cobyric acid decarboxylase-like protein